MARRSKTHGAALLIVAVAVGACGAFSGESSAGNDGADAGVDGGSSDGSATDADQLSEANDVDAGEMKIVFVSSILYGPAPSATKAGTFTDVAGADAACANLAAASKKKLTGTFKAWISESTSTVATRFTPSDVPYARTDGMVVAMDWNAIASGNPLLNPISYDENGKIVAGSESVWTATAANGSLDTEGDCALWTSTSSGAHGGIGLATDANLWTDGQRSITCDQVAHLYCFEQ